MVEGADAGCSAAAGLLSEVHMSIIKGNAGESELARPFPGGKKLIIFSLFCLTGEIGAIFGSEEVKARGVDSVGTGFKDPATIVEDLARRESEYRVPFDLRRKAGADCVT